jgi:uncharacterized membrane protein YeiH
MSWRRWKLGVLVSVVLSLFVAGAGLAAGMKWQAFISVLCTALVTHFGSFLKDHPIEQITWDTDQITKGTSVPAKEKEETK